MASAGFARPECLFRESLSPGIDRSAADGLFVEFENEGKLLLDRPENAQGLGHHFRTDSIAGQHGNLVGVAHLLSHASSRMSLWQAVGMPGGRDLNTPGCDQGCPARPE